MKSIYENVKTKAQSEILNASNQDLFSKKFEITIYDKLKIVSPYLNIEETLVSIDKERLTLENAPPNISFTPGKEMEFAQFTVPIIGYIDLFNKVVSNHHWSRTRFIDGQTLICKEFAPGGIAGNDEVINLLKAQAKVAIDSIRHILDQFTTASGEFNENQLKQYISNLIIQERTRRNSIDDATKKLNPFK